MTNHVDEKSRIEKAAILELLRTARTMKRQLKILKGIALREEERKLLREVIEKVEEDCKLFKL
ncbi:MAG: hypothetical protein K0Q48_3425 [Bacillota bacterium]|jgi:RNase P/RNase MRP subunit p30|nr:hypothetical protein [Bacillota bacterium]